MRKITLFLLLIHTFCLRAQWSENFADGNLTQHPAWSGTPDWFNINTAQQLQLNATAAGSAWLSTPSVLRKGTTWEFWVKMNFNPSQYNYTRIYLASNNTDPSASTSGYYVTIGGINDKVNLTKKTSATSTTEIIAGETGQLNLSAVAANIRVEYTHQSVWRLFVKLSTDADYVLKGEYTDLSPVSGEFFTLQLVYTVSNIKNFFFDDIVTSYTAEKDTVAPSIESLSVTGDRSLAVRFTEPVDVAAASFAIAGQDEFGQTNLSADAQTVNLTFATPFSSGKSYQLTISGVKDTTGNAMSTQQRAFTYWPELKTAQAGDVVISEIMANPSGAAHLPEAEYVEIHNNSTGKVNLADWKLYYGDKAMTFPPVWLLPDSFLVLGNATSVAKLGKDVPTLALESFPVLANSGKLISLESADGSLISFANYTDQWYGDDFKAGGGFSLECIDLHNVSGCKANWHATNNTNGGTPGRTNSIAAVNPDNEQPSIVQKSLVSADTTRLTFSAVMNKQELLNKENYQLNSDFRIKTLIAATPLPNAVLLVLERPLAVAEELQISPRNLHSISGNALASTSIIRLALCEMAEPHDAVINEILFNPRPNGADYVELYNRSNRIIDVSKLFLTSKKADGSLQTGIRLADVATPFFPGDYLVFTTNKANILSEYGNAGSSSIMEISSLPSLPDTEGNIQLINSSAQTIDGFFYSQKMHHPFIKNPEGVALERLSSELPASDAANWQSAAGTAGWGTPGLKNSQQLMGATDKTGFWLEDETITPDNNGINDVLKIHYALPEGGYTAHLRIYTPGGKLIASLAANQILGTEGLFVWNGTNTTGAPARPGIYILYIEYYKSDRSPVCRKLPVVVGN